MPCYLFTYHAYGTWMPDRERGFVRRGQGVLPPDRELAGKYRGLATQDQVAFTERIQRVLIEEALVAAEKQDFRLHGVATEPTHLHALVSWRDDRAWQRLRIAIKSSLTRRLNRELGRQTWFVRSASRRRVKERRHFDYHMEVYLPSHRGWKYDERHGIYR